MASTEAQFMELSENVDQATRRLDLATRELMKLGDAQRATDCLHTAVGRCKSLSALLRRSVDRR